MVAVAGLIAFRRRSLV
ncbi:hypothetical protein [Thalassobacter stenotrophicus]